MLASIPSFLGSPSALQKLLEIPRPVPASEKASCVCLSFVYFYFLWVWYTIPTEEEGGGGEEISPSFSPEGHFRRTNFSSPRLCLQNRRCLSVGSLHLLLRSPVPRVPFFITRGGRGGRVCMAEKGLPGTSLQKIPPKVPSDSFRERRRTERGPTMLLMLQRTCFDVITSGN